MTEDMKLVLKVLIPIIILLVILCVYCWDKWITITIIFGFIFCCALGSLDAIGKIGMSETQTYTTVEDKYIQTSGKITNYYAKVKVGEWFFGHMHINEDFKEENAIGIYEQIIRIT